MIVLDTILVRDACRDAYGDKPPAEIGVILIFNACVGWWKYGDNRPPY